MQSFPEKRKNAEHDLGAKLVQNTLKSFMKVPINPAWEEG